MITFYEILDGVFLYNRLCLDLSFNNKYDFRIFLQMHICLYTHYYVHISYSQAWFISPVIIHCTFILMNKLTVKFSSKLHIFVDYLTLRNVKVASPYLASLMHIARERENKFWSNKANGQPKRYSNLKLIRLRRMCCTLYTYLTVKWTSFGWIALF